MMKNKTWSLLFYKWLSLYYTIYNKYNNVYGNKRASNFATNI